MSKTRRNNKDGSFGELADILEAKETPLPTKSELKKRYQQKKAAAGRERKAALAALEPYDSRVEKGSHGDYLAFKRNVLPPFGTEISLPDDVLATYWRTFNWDIAEYELRKNQRELAIAATNRDWPMVRNWQRIITDSIETKMLAVNRVTRAGISNARDWKDWITDAQKMRGAINLRSDHYVASPVFHFSKCDRAKAKYRTYGVPTIRDRIMHALYVYALAPVAESLGDRKSFGFRMGRSTLDTHYYILEVFNRKNPPEWILVADIKSFYESIDHNWLLEHIPMRKNVLREFIKKGVILQKDDIPPPQFGIDLGTSLSPILANMVLDGLEWRMFSLQENWYFDRNNVDYSDGNVVRYADDIFITARTYGSAIQFKLELESFLAERSLKLNQDKTKIVNINEGFTYLSRFYKKEHGKVRSYPDKESIQQFVNELDYFLFTYPDDWSQEGLISEINRKLNGFATYHKVTDAERAFTYIDSAVNAILLKLMKKYYEYMSIDGLIKKFWYKDVKGRMVYALEMDKGIRVMKLEDVILVTPQKLKTKANPFIHREYFAARLDSAEVSRASGKNKAIWQRQDGKCYICGKAILPDHERQLMQIDCTVGHKRDNLAYVHCECMERQFFKFHSDRYDIEDIDVMDLAQALAEDTPIEKIRENSHPALREFFENTSKKKIVLLFRQLENYLDSPLPDLAYSSEEFWHLRNEDHISHIWQQFGFSIQRIDLQKGKIIFVRTKQPAGRIKIPSKLQRQDLPEKLVYEVNNHFAYVIKKYGL